MAAASVQRFSKRIQVMPLLRQAREAASTLSTSEVPALKSEVERMAAELRRLRLAEEKAAELAAALTKRCELCFDEVSVEQVGSLMCPNEHLICSDCSPDMVRNFLERIGASDTMLDDHSSRGGLIPCVRHNPAFQPQCSRHYTDQSLARALPDEIFVGYRAAQDDVTENRIWHQHNQRFQEEVSRMQRQLEGEQATKREEAASTEFLRRQYPNAKMCPRCRCGPVINENCFDLQSHHNEASSLASKVKDASVTELQGVVTNLPPEDRDKVKAALDLVPRPPKNCRRRVKCGGKTFAPFGLRDDFQPPDPAKTKDFTPYQPEDGLPEKVDLRNFMSPIEDQSQTNSCCANAVAGAFEYINCKHAGETGDTRGDVSRLFIYYVGRKKDMADEGAMWGKKNSKRAPKDEGMTIQAAISAMQVSGACLAESWPYDLDKVNEKPGEECFKEAQRYRVLAAERVPMDLDAMRQCLARGNPIIFGLMLTDSFFRPGRGGFVSTPNKTDKRAAQHGLHAMLLVGYNDRQQVFIVRNSWGESWGDRGYGYVGYDYIANMDYNFLQQFTITGLTNADFTPGPDDGEDFDITDNTDDVSGVISAPAEPVRPPSVERAEELDSVTIKLHPTFKDPVRVRQEPPFEFQSRGWGTFDIVVLLKWKNGSIHRTSWELQFDQPDASRPLDLPRAAPAAPAVPAAPAAPAAPVPPRTVPEGTMAPSVEVPPVAPWEEEHRDVFEARGSIDTSAGTTDDDPTRASICERLRSTAYLPHSHPQFMFGPTEFEDQPEVMAAKVKELARLMLMSRKTVAYTGAGISAAVIGQAALSGQHTVGWKADTRAAPPTFTHHALGFLGRQGLLHGWVQQNHDGLPQKAGFPQERINEIHGSWYDPGNPVVKYSGTLHETWLQMAFVATKTADRSLQPSAPPEGVLAPGAWVMLRRGGRSFKGCVTKVEEKDFQARFRPAADDDSEEEDDAWEEKGATSSDRLGEVVTISKSEKFDLLPSVGGGLGTVIMNLQQTAQDGKMTLRLFGKSDEILRLLLPELGFGLSIVKPPVWPKVSRALVPYDAEGRRLPPRAKRMWLDLSRGQEVRLTPGHNIQGAKQPQYMHIGAAKPITVKGETRKPGVGLGRVVNRCDKTCSFVLQIEGVQMLGFCEGMN
eukprot:g22285.t2